MNDNMPPDLDDKDDSDPSSEQTSGEPAKQSQLPGVVSANAGSSDPSEEQIEQIVEQKLTLWSGPLPHPEALEDFEKVLPGAADRIVGMAERQSKHRQNLEATRLNSDVSLAKLGLWLGFVIAMTMIVGGIRLLYIGREVPGFVTVSLPIAGISFTWLWNRWEKSRELMRNQAGTDSESGDNRS